MQSLPGQILLDERQIQNRILELGRRISADYDGRELVLIGVLKGAVIFLADLMRAITIPHTFDLVGASSYGNRTKSSGQVTITKDVTVDLKGKDILLVDDIYDSGRTLKVLMGLLDLHHPASIAAACLVVKDCPRQEEVAVRYAGFTLPDLFIVGYGLDYAERYRNLRCLVAYEPDAKPEFV
ncbi:MAG TPA: hypoxanthine phosphoribosyltransferase [Candidatus Sumerlaeota bacterium]|nr:hypoxanthine phosphoribosyltransferase [Candidatus Sumerlaeota bacterium]